MKILDERQISQKIKRLAIEILEHNYSEKEIILAGINNNGLGFAKMLHRELKKISEIKFTLSQIMLNPAKPIDAAIELDTDVAELHKKVIIVVDDVANTGRTIFYAFKPLFDILPKKIEVAVLVDRMHKSFPIKVDYVGLSLSTTLQDNINVQILNTDDKAVYLV